jgi:lipopolysaccharide transport system ATP-binding protein
MPSITAVTVRNVSKKFRLFASHKERLLEALHPFRKQYHREFWALRDVSLEVGRGETVGILGRNGSGKSTLLQIICSVMQATHGEVRVNGRISALLELGAGFNPEFTGRDNVILNGAIMGVQRKEMLIRLPEIEAFADIGEFFDQPVKTYSSGMFVRVAFAAAINVEPDILVVDEALAVGDAKFQQRCFNKFRELQDRGVTIIFVTHDVESIVRHCQRAILLNAGTIVTDGHPTIAVQHYIDLMEGRLASPPVYAGDKGYLGTSHRDSSRIGSQNDALEQFIAEQPIKDVCSKRCSYNPKEHHQPSQCAMIVDYLLVTGDRVDPTHICSGQVVDIFFKVLFIDAVKQPCFGLSVKTQDGVTIYALNSSWTDVELHAAIPGECRVVRFRTPMLVNSGDIFLDFGVDEVMMVDTYKCITRRMAIVHLVVLPACTFHGLANLGAQFTEGTCPTPNLAW